MHARRRYNAFILTYTHRIKHHLFVMHRIYELNSLYQTKKNKKKKNLDIFLCCRPFFIRVSHCSIFVMILMLRNATTCYLHFDLQIIKQIFIYIYFFIDISFSTLKCKINYFKHLSLIIYERHVV